MYDHTDETPMDRNPTMHGEEADLIREAGRKAAEAARDDARDYAREMDREDLEKTVPNAHITSCGERFVVELPYDTFETRDFDRLHRAGFRVVGVSEAYRITVTRA